MATSPVRLGSGNVLPGHRSPAVGPEAPFEMLEACHERVQRSLQLLHKLQTYLAHTGHDASAAQAAQDVLRYFNLAAPLHHQDEELHVFPPLLELQDATLTTAVHQLIADHRAMEAAWGPAAAVLQCIASGAASEAGCAWPPLTAAQTASLQKFADLYGPHIALEEGVVYPRARALLSAEALLAMSADMVRRRTNR
jgi:hemerythrin-like domain-containing protein